MGTLNSTYYLYFDQEFWLNSPSRYANYFSFVFSISGEELSNDSFGVRPVISLKETDVVETGNGTRYNPYVIKTS